MCLPAGRASSDEIEQSHRRGVGPAPGAARDARGGLRHPASGGWWATASTRPRSRSRRRAPRWPRPRFEPADDRPADLRLDGPGPGRARDGAQRRGRARLSRRLGVRRQERVQQLRRGHPGRRGDDRERFGPAGARGHRRDVRRSPRATGSTDRRGFRHAFIGYTVGDVGGAFVLEPSDDAAWRLLPPRPLESEHWSFARCRAGAPAIPRGDEYPYAGGDGGALRDIFRAFDPDDRPARVSRDRHDAGTTSRCSSSTRSPAPLADEIVERLGLPARAGRVTVAEHGNVAAASLPLALAWPARRGASAAATTCCSSGSGPASASRRWRSGCDRAGPGSSALEGRPLVAARAGPARGPPVEMLVPGDADTWVAVPALDEAAGIGRDARRARGADAAAARRVRRRQRQHGRDGRASCGRLAARLPRRGHRRAPRRRAGEGDRRRGRHRDAGRARRRRAVPAADRRRQLPRPGWAARMRERLASGIDLVAGRMVDRATTATRSRRASRCGSARGPAPFGAVPKQLAAAVPDPVPADDGLQLRDPRRDVRAVGGFPRSADRRGPRRPGADEPDPPGHRPDHRATAARRRVERAPLPRGTGAPASSLVHPPRQRRRADRCPLTARGRRDPLLPWAIGSRSVCRPASDGPAGGRRGCGSSVSPLAYLGLRAVGRRRVVRLGRFGTLVNDPVLGRRSSSTLRGSGRSGRAPTAS